MGRTRCSKGVEARAEPKFESAVSRVSWRSARWDNTVAEPFFGSSKKERTKKHIFRHREFALAGVAGHLEVFSNRTRRHSNLGGLSQEQFEVGHRGRSRGVQ